MAKISVLPDHIANQIAAGEVIERPFSVVKELTENSLDAGATQIEIAVSSDCRDVRVADNGCGMAAEDAVLAFSRHATSKLSSVDDLWSLRSMGFRGEALPSIGSVSRVTCYSRIQEEISGIKVEAAEGKVVAVETGCAPGTVVDVVDLFYNVPARMKFLKKPSTEFALIHETVQALAIAYPKVTFQLLKAGEMVFKTTGSGKLAQAMQEARFLHGDETLFPVTYAELKFGMAVYGYIASPTHFRGDRKGILAIVNNRPVKCSLTYKALEQAYADLVPKGKHPLAVLTITIDPQEVDVNVHPTKREIKYSSGNDVYQAIHRAVASAYQNARKEPVVDESGVDRSGADRSLNYHIQKPAGTLGGEQPESTNAAAGTVREDAPVSPAAAQVISQQMRFRDRLAYAPAGGGLTPAQGMPVVTRLRAQAAFPAEWRVAGYLHNTYILIESPSGLEIIEQHIAHERTIYERIRAQQDTPGRLCEHAQRLVISAPLNLTPEQRALVEENIESLRKLGFDFEGQGGSSVVCTQVPLELAHKDYAQMVQRIIDDLASNRDAELELEATKSIACQAAIKNGMLLSDTDIIQLVAEWHQSPRNQTCPHGRPIKLSMSREKLFDLFHPA